MGKWLNRLYLVYFKYKNKKNGCVFAKKSCISSGDFFEGDNHISGKVLDCFVGRGTYISDRCFFRNCKIGRFCSIAPGVQILRGSHPTGGFVSTSPAFYLKDSPVGPSYVKTDSYTPDRRCKADPGFEAVIGNDVWIGQQAMIMQGVTVGDGAIIGAGALVTKDIPPYAIAVGVPARVLRYRFEEEQIQKLLQIRWWDKNKEWIKENAEYFRDIELFLEKSH